MPDRHIRLLPQGALLALFCLGLFAPAVQAVESETIRLSPGFSKLIPLKPNQTIGTVVIGSPDVVEATLQGDKAVLLTAKRITGAAATNVIILDPQNTEIFNATIAVGFGSGKIEIHSKGRDSRPQSGTVHEYWAYRCSPICDRVEDKFEAIQSSNVPAEAPPPGPPAQVAAPQQAAPQ